MHIHVPSWVTPPLVISTLALLFTIASFWWIQARRGRLHSYPPRSYAGGFPGRDLRLVLPLVLHNTGPAPIAVVDFRLRIDKRTGHDDPALPVVLSWQAVQGQIEPGEHP